MDKRILLFNKHFERWGIALQPDAEQRCPKGTIVSRGWTVKYCFGKDQDGKFLDYYAAHRMTNDRHLRIRDNGDVEGLPAYPMRFNDGNRSTSKSSTIEFADTAIMAASAPRSTSRHHFEARRYPASPGYSTAARPGYGGTRPAPLHPKARNSAESIVSKS